MKRHNDYEAPELYLIEIQVESGYASSLENPTENEEMDW